MVQQSGTNARFLQAPVALGQIMKVLEPDLKFYDVIPRVDSQGQPIMYLTKGSKSADGKKQTPQIRTPSSKFPEVQITRMTKTSALLGKEGLSIRFDEDALRLPAGADMIMDGFQTVAYWLAEYVNTNIYSVLDAGSTDAGMSPTATWDSATATPFEDLRNFKNGMKREGYPYRMTDIYLEMGNYNELEGYLANVDITDAQRNMIYGKPELNMDVINIPLIGNVHGLFSGITTGDLMGLDRNHPGYALYYWNDPKYSMNEISYETVVDGKPVVKTVPNFGLNYHQYFENDTHDTVIQLWFDYKVVVKDAYSVITDNGI